VGENSQPEEVPDCGEEEEEALPVLSPPPHTQEFLDFRDVLCDELMKRLLLGLSFT
jgi:hypothetical protein